MIPEIKQCVECGADFEVGCMDGKRKRCWVCRCQRAEAELKQARARLKEVEGWWKTKDSLDAMRPFTIMADDAQYTVTVWIDGDAHAGNGYTLEEAVEDLMVKLGVEEK